jgi:integrase
LESFDDWRKKPVIEITRDMVAKRHSKLGERSEARANLAMRLLRAMFNFAAGEYEDETGKPFILENPVKRLSHTRAWYRVNRRQTLIKKHDLPRWYEAVMNIETERSSSKADSIRDYLLLLIFTGLRRTEAAKLTWDNVDFQSKTITITDTKNNERHVLPLSDFLYDMLTQRKAQAESSYVFAGTGVTGYIIEPRKVIAKVVEKSGVSFTLHDLRRTFITIAESLDIPAYALKRLLNHMNKADVTAGYLVIDVERLRKPMQMLTDHLLVLMGVKQVAPVVKLKFKKS